MAWLRLALAAPLLFFAGLVLAQTCGVPGRDGPVTASGVINSYHAGSGSPAAGATSISVASATGQRTNTRALRAGDLILIMQMQDSATPANAGQHEYAQIASITGTTLALDRPLANSYAQTMNTTNVRNWQVVWVPQYSSAAISGTVSADRWTINNTTGASTGGVVALDVAGSLNLTGTITVAGAGFRGASGLSGTANYGAGTATTANNNYTVTSAATIYGGQKGEGLQGTPPNVFDGTATPVSYVTLLGQGYSATGGAGGQQAIGNAGGGSNDGLPATGANQYNGGGGGGGNAGAGGQGGNSWNNGDTATPALNQGTNTNIGNVVGGKGGNAQANSATRLPMGGGGGAGSANNGGTSAVTQWPPAVSATAANGAAGIVTSSGAPGGGVVLVRAGSLTAAGAVIDASGYRAFNKNAGAGGTDTDGGGGGGGGGSVFITAASGAGAGLSINATGGDGGSTNYFNHGPGGGGGGGYIVTNLTGATTNVNGGINGQDACCGGTAGNGSPKAWNSAPGSAGTVVTSGGTASGTQGGAACLPVLTVTKTTLTPTLTSAPGATAQFKINVSNTGGAATNLFLFDQTLPPGWAYTGSQAPTFAYSPAPPAAAGSEAAGAESTSASAPGALPVSSVTTVNSISAVTLRANGSAPGVTPTTGNNTLTFGSFYLPQNGSITVSFAVTIPATATVGTYHNPAGAIFLDPTRVSGAATRMVTPLTDATSNRAGVAYSNTGYASGATANVAGANYSGLQGGPAGEDVQLLPDFSITKGAVTSIATGSTFLYTITPRNSGWPVGSQTYAVTQATDVTTANVPSVLAANPLTVTDTFPTGATLTGAMTGTGWSCSGGQTQVCTLANANAWPIASGAAFPTIGAVVTASCAGGTTLTNTVTVSSGVGEVTSSNNTATTRTLVTGCGTANIQVAKTNGTVTVVSGSTTSYTVTISNLGPSAAGGTRLVDTPSSGLSCTAATCTGAGGAVCPASSMPFTSLTTGITIPTLPVSGTATLVISCGVQ